MEKHQSVLLLTPPEADKGVSPLWEVLMEPMAEILLRRGVQAGFTRCVVLVKKNVWPKESASPKNCEIWTMGTETLTQEITAAQKRIRRQWTQTECVVTLPWNMPLISKETLRALAQASQEEFWAKIPEEERLAVTDNVVLSEVNGFLQNKINRFWMKQGVEIPFPQQTVIGLDVQLAPGSRILPGCVLRGSVTVEEGCAIGPNTTLADCSIGRNTVIKASWLTECQVGDHCTVGPYSHLRPGCIVEDEVKIGDFVELKNALVGRGTSIAHLTYLGDCDVGENCNFGCGVVTANYDGKRKHKTVIGSRSFVGCNTNLIAPVTLGEGVYTAAGVTVTQEVPSGALVLGRNRQEIKAGWADENVGFKT